MIEINRNPSARELRQFAGIWLPLAAAVAGTVVANQSASWLPAGIIWTLGAVLGAAGVWRPRLVRPVFVGWITAAYPIGWVVSNLVLAMLFFLVVTPIGLLLRQVRRDPLARTFDRARDSYWEPRSASRDVGGYFRQF
jgi:hypothetical protein